MPKGKSSALWALALSGGVWAWQNRDKIKGWVNSQSSQWRQQSEQWQQQSGQNPPSSIQSHQPSIQNRPQTTPGAFTGSTRRIDDPSL